MSASGRDGLSFIQRASATWDSVGAAAQGGIIGVISAGFALFIEFWGAIADTIIVPLSRMGPLLAGILDAFIGGAAQIVGQGAVTSARSLVPGSFFAAGPLTFAEGIAAAGLGLLVMAWILGRGPTSDTIPFSFTDIPFLGVDEEEEDEITE